MLRSALATVMMLGAMMPLRAQDTPSKPAMVFFDWGKGEIRRDDQQVLDQVAERWRAAPATRLVLSGHSDRSGPGWANVRASRKRAETVRDYLVDRGVPRSAMVIQAFGEQRPVIDTEDGVREVQNRRVEISVVTSP